MKNKLANLKNIITIILLSLIFNNYVFAEKYSKNIERLQDNISTINKKLSSIESKIKETDIHIANKTKLLLKANSNLNDTLNKQASLKKQKAHYLERYNKQKQALASQLKALYELHRKKSNFELVDLEKINNIEQLNRMSEYLKTYKNYNDDLITKIKSSILRIESLDENLNLLKKSQLNYQAKIKKSYQELTLLKADNLRAKKDLQLTLNKNLADLDYYQSQQDKLNSILNKNFARNNKTQEIITQFSKIKGKLPIPVNGNIETKFKNNKNQNSIFIKTKEGEKVNAVYSGKVVFSNWLRGFGFITIIDHGDGYMSLYGNNQALFKKTDDFVEAGETIAVTGSSGGINTPGLYFEIRYNGTAVDTASWISHNKQIYS